MTQEEAANILWWASKRHYPGDQMDITAEDIEAFDMAIAALRSPERDPDTGAKDAFSLRMTAIRRFIGIRTECTPESKATGSGCIRKLDARCGKLGGHMLNRDGVKTCDDGDIRVYEHYGINMPLRARYVRYPNRIYFATDPEHGEMMSFFCSAEKPSSCARGLAWYWGEKASHLVCVDELEPTRPGAIGPDAGEMDQNGDGNA